MAGARRTHASAAQVQRSASPVPTLPRCRYPYTFTKVDFAARPESDCNRLTLKQWFSFEYPVTRESGRVLAAASFQTSYSAAAYATNKSQQPTRTVFNRPRVEQRHHKNRLSTRAPVFVTRTQQLEAKYQSPKRAAPRDAVSR
jgi:hypothetical protein